MKTLLATLFLIATVAWSCAPPTETVVPQAEKAERCHLQSDAIVELQEAGHDGTDPFWYLVLLNEKGERKEEVHPHQLATTLQELGKKVRITYHFNLLEDFQYVSACGNGVEGEETIESIREVFVCEISEVGI